MWFAACGDNTPLAQTHDLVIVAHQDDDLLFMQPDMRDVVHAHQPATIVYVTAGDGGNGVTYASSRITAIKAAYGWFAGSQDWTCTWIKLRDHAMQRCELPIAHLELLFMGYPDGGIPGSAPNSLLHLWEGAVDHADTVAERVATYDRPALIATLAEIITLARPTVIRTLEVAGTHGGDHSDHMMVGALVVLAAAVANTDARLLSYRGYNTTSDPVNTSAAMFDEVSLGMRAYQACQINCASCVDAVCTDVSNAWYDAMLRRHYAIAMRETPVSGLLQIGGRCVVVRGREVALDVCSQGTELAFDRHGHIHAGPRCLRVAGDNQLVAEGCEVGADGYFLLDEEGHLWSGVAPPPGPDMAYDHAMCVTADDTVHLAVCGAKLDARWVLGRLPGATQRSEIGMPARGRSVRLADVTGDGDADLCWVVRGAGLWCAAGDGAGGFVPARRIDAPQAALQVEPESLMLGDLDGDGLTDACGRTTKGIACAFAADGYAAALWSPAFARVGAAAPGDRSLAIVDREVCGMTDAGIACAAQGERATMHSTWMAGGAAVWPADLDGDAAADWCAAMPDGPACGLAADRAVTSDGIPWGFAMHATVEGSVQRDGAAPDQVHGALADVSGDGRADLCVVAGGYVSCALSHGHAFGPRFPVLTLPATGAAQALWLGDLDGDGKADPCVDDGTAITCALSP